MKSQKNKLIVNNFQNVYYKITFNAVNLSKKAQKMAYFGLFNR